jgi:hypothetical protein
MRLMTVVTLLSLSLAGCGSGADHGALGVRWELSREANRLALLSEQTGTVTLVPAPHDYWVALVASGTGAIPSVPDARDPSVSCGSDRSRSYVLVGDGHGTVTCVKTARRIDISGTAPRCVRKVQGEAVRFLLARDQEGRVHITAMY